VLICSTFLPQQFVAVDFSSDAMTAGRLIVPRCDVSAIPVIVCALLFIFSSPFLSFLFSNLYLFSYTQFFSPLYNILALFEKQSKIHPSLFVRRFSLSIIQQGTANMAGVGLDKTCYRVPTRNFDCSVAGFYTARVNAFRKGRYFTCGVERLGRSFSPK
jgi:hypothetical protein